MPPARPSLSRVTLQYLVVCVVGLVSSFLLSDYIRERSRTESVLRLEQRAQQLTVAVQQSVNAKLQVLQAFQAFYGVGQLITLEEFKKFAVVTLTYHPDIQALQWVPLVPANQLDGLIAEGRDQFGADFDVFERDSAGARQPLQPRPFYFPIYYIEPMAGNEAAHGLDAGFEPVRRAVLEEAWYSGRATVSTPIRLVQETGDQSGVLLYQPIYRDIFPPEDEAARVETLVGLVPVVLRTGDFMAASLADFDITGFRLSLYDADTPDRLLYESQPADLTESAYDFHTTGVITVANRRWILDFDTSAAFIDQSTNFSGLITRLGVLLMTAVALFYLYQRNRSEAALRQYASTLETTNKELDAYNHTIAHDLKSPLAIVNGYAYLLMDEPLSDEGRKMVDTVAMVTHNMADMIDDLLKLASLREAEAAVTRVDMGAVLESALQRIEDRRQFVTLEGDLPSALGHAPWLTEVFANLINNALKYTPADRTPDIRVRGMVQGTMMRYEVQDNGVGIAPEDRQRIFDLFTRLPNEGMAKGLGIGLSIVRRVIERLGGQIGVEGAPGQGSTFWFTLPAG